MRVKECMTSQPRFCTPEDTIDRVARAMKEGDFGAMPVLDGERAIGIITDRDIAIRAVAEDRNPAQATAREIMTPECVTLPADTDCEEAAKLMEQRQIRRIAITDENGKLCGMLALADIAREGADQATCGEVIEQVSKPA